MATWSEVQTKPEFQKLSPEQKEQARSDYFTEVVAPKVSKEELATARADFDKATGQSTKPTDQKAAQPQRTGLFGDPNPMPSPMTDAISEPFMKAVTGAGATALGGLRSLVGAVGGDENSGEKGQAFAQSHTYEPRSQIGQAVSKAVEYPGSKLGEGANVIGRNVAEVTHSPALGALANTATQAAAQVLLGKGAGLAGEAVGLGKSATGAAAGSRAAMRAAPSTLDLAKDYATTKLGGKWEDLPPEVQKETQDGRA